MLKVNPEERLSITELVNLLQEIAAARNVNPKSPITEVAPLSSALTRRCDAAIKIDHIIDNNKEVASLLILILYLFETWLLLCGGSIEILPTLLLPVCVCVCVRTCKRVLKLLMWLHLHTLTEEGSKRPVCCLQRSSLPTLHAAKETT